MNSKWYFSTLFLILCICFGAFQEQVVHPNQEIVLEFVDGKNNNEDIRNTIKNVKEKLVDFGASHIVIKDIENGTLKISYYATVPVDNIKQALNLVNQFASNQSSKHGKKNHQQSTYNIDIYELTDTIESTD